MIKKLLFSFILSVLSIFFLNAIVFAEVVNFRSPNDNNACYPISLNETIAVKVNGSAGPGCDFSVDVIGGGEWVGTGDYFDSPPYAWGTDTFYPDEKKRGREYSFTCSQPAYSLDTSKLPTYISFIREEDIPGSATTTPKGKRYYFSVGDGAQSGGSFTPIFSYSTNCSMKDSRGIMESVEKGTSDCDGKKPITINPRVRTSSAPITIGASCNPSPTPTPSPIPTSTPTPTLTPTPTATPRPTNTPTPTPTPFNAAACKCDGIEYTDLFSGQSVTITSFGKVEGADTSKAIVKDQSFFLAEGAETIARIIGRSGPISSIVVPSTPGKVRFQSKWTFTLPQLKLGATYRIWSQVNCQPKLQALNYTPARKAVLATSTSPQPKSFIQRMIDFLNNLFGGGSSSTTLTPEPNTETGIVLEEPTPTEVKSLQLGTIYPVEVYQKTCSFIKFRTDQLSR